MRTKSKKIAEGINLITLKEENMIRYFIIGDDYELGYEIFSLIDEGDFDEKKFLDNLNIKIINDTLDEINNREEDDCLYHDMDEVSMLPKVGEIE